ncbi:N-acetyltransferase [Synechococcus sp. Lug-A]|uniref:GNAT family N-acetyltransferase n=1 Tax=Synechococcus sp. Lug-A TaxID=2823740 RepID=UPI0020CC3FA5|nr:N-acetyltransferase [Synechococcus sp. Lug-A]MCP9847897.1 N-acetyltransferase [Synechococcus sp. Lug-A]
MQFELLRKDSQADLELLFQSTFSSTEGEDEGKLIGSLASKLASNIDDTNVFCFGAIEDRSVIGAVFLTRLTFQDESLVYMLAPVAVLTTHQRSGIGKELIRFAMEFMAKAGTEVVVTYGDPEFYGKAGFTPLSEKVLQSPMELSMPFGWLGKSLTDKPIQTRSDKPSCVEAFRNPTYW